MRVYRRDSVVGEMEFEERREVRQLGKGVNAIGEDLGGGRGRRERAMVKGEAEGEGEGDGKDEG